jgi:hypothetical protein
MEPRNGFSSDAALIDPVHSRYLRLQMELGDRKAACRGRRKGSRSKDRVS